MEIIHEDSDIIVINKPGGLLSVPGRGPQKQDSVSRRLQHLYPDMINQPAVHRLDMFTTGLMVFARTKETHRNLSIQFEKRQIKKQYIAVVGRNIRRNKGEIHLCFRLDPDNRPIQIYDPILGKKGSTLWRKMSSNDSSSRIEFTPITGRTHQLRLHSAHPLGLNASIIGDSLYGQGRDGDAMMLCSTLLGFHHPQNNTWIQFELDPPF